MKKDKLRRAAVSYQDEHAGIIEEIEQGFRFTYDENFIKKNRIISVSLPLKDASFESNELFPFFTGLLPEGWYLEVVCSTLKIDKSDLFGILIATCKDTVGAVGIKEMQGT